MQTSTPTYYKVLNTDSTCYHGGSGKWPANRWMPKLDATKLDPCVYGYHILCLQDLIYWLGPAIAPVTVDPSSPIIIHENKVVVARAKRGPFLTTWNKRTQRLFAADCAEHVLHFYTDKFPNDDRPAKAIQTARDYANGLISKEQLAYAATAAAAYATAATAATAAYAAYAAYAATAAFERDWQTKKLLEYLEIPNPVGGN